MARKQVGMVDAELLARVDERAAVLGQTRRVFVERALLSALGPDLPGPLPVAEQERIREEFRKPIVEARMEPPRQLSRSEMFKRATQKS